MKQKPGFPTELAYVLGIVTLAFGTGLMERADFGMSMVVAPAYLLHLIVSQTYPFFTFGTAEYYFQAALLIVMCLVLRQFKVSYLFSFVTAVFYGFTLDACMALVALIPGDGLMFRLLFYVLGLIVCAMGVSMLFHTYIAPEVYELFVKEIAARTGKNINVCKTAYDCTSCAVGIVMSFAFFGLWHFEGVKLGTIFCALVNGATIGLCSKILEASFEFRDALNLRKYFQ